MASSEGWNTPGKSMLDDAPAQEGLSVEGGGLQPSRSKTLRKNPIFMGLVASVVVQALVIGAFLLGNNWTSNSTPDYSCLYALGGGKVSAQGGFPQSRIHDKSSDCSSVLKEYFEGGQYAKDVQSVGDQALVYTRALTGVTHRSLLVFDIDETTLSNIAEFREEDFGALDLTAEAHDRLMNAAESPPLEPIRAVYLDAYTRGMSVAFITGRDENSRQATERNLAAAGYGKQCENMGDLQSAVRSEDPCYIVLWLRDVELDAHKPASVYKPEARQKLENAGYNIVGSFGDQFSDLEGTNEGVTSWKLPNPMYYIL